MSRCVIASSKLWRPAIAAQVARRTGWECSLLTKPEELTPAVLSKLGPDLVFLPHWSHKIPADVYERWTCVVFHMTDLPYGRGGSPLQNLIVRGARETKICALKCVAELDAGPVYLRRPLTLQGSAQDIFVAANGMIEDMIVEIIEHRPHAVAQAGAPTVFKRRTPQDGNIADLATLEQAYDHIRMLDAEGYPPAFLQTGNLRLEFSRARLSGGRIVADVTLTRKADDE